VADPAESCYGSAEGCEEDASIFVVKEDPLTCISATGDVVESSFELDTQRSGHDATSLADRNSKIKL